MNIQGISPVKTSFFDEFTDPRKEYEVNTEKLWVPWERFQEIEKEFPYFSRNPIVEGLLFKKSKKSAWFRNKFYILYQDRLLYYKNDSHYPYKVMLLRGVTLHLAEDVVTTNEMEIKLTSEDIEKRCFIFTRNKLYSIVSAGTAEYHSRWLSALRSCMILTNFSKYYSIERPIAKGTFAKVIECRNHEDNHLYAVKTLDKQSILNSSSAVRSKIGLINEINVLRRLDHMHIIRLFEVYEGKHNIYLVMENLKGGEIFNEILKVGNFSEKQSSVIMCQLLSALDYIHSKGFVHRDVKLENLIFVNEGTLDMKIADFGLSENLSKKECLFKRCGTPGYVAPEILEDQQVNTKCDIFSAGVVLYILLTGYSPFYAPNYHEILVKNKICQIGYNTLELYGVKLSPEAIDLLQWMLQYDPAKRPTAREAMNHEWFLGLMNPEEKQKHRNLQRQQAKQLKGHELKIQPKVMKKSKSIIDFTMKTPDFYIPFDPNKLDRSPIMTPEILAANVKNQPTSKDVQQYPEESKNGFNGNKEICFSIDDLPDKKPEEVAYQGSTPMLRNLDDDPPKIMKKYFSSTSLRYRKQSTKEIQLDQLKIDK